MTTTTISTADGPIPDEFPLSISGNGQFRKKFRGKEHRFGPVSAGWKAALKRFDREWKYIIAGRTPPPVAEGGTTLGTIAALFIAREAERVKRGELHERTFVDDRKSVEIAADVLGHDIDPEILGPDDFAKLRYELGFLWDRDHEAGTLTKTEVRGGVCAWKRRISAVRRMFRWAGPKPDGKGYIAAPHYGGQFKSIGDSTLLKNSHARARERGKKLFTPEEVQKIIKELEDEPQLKAMFLLSINAGFTSADCSAVPWRAIDLDGGWMDFPRVKNSNDRPRIPLWRDTLKSLKAVKALNLQCKPALAETVVFQQVGQNREPIGQPVKLKDCVFVHPDGRAWATGNKGEVDANGFSVTYSNRDRIGQDRFRDLLIRLGIHRKGIGFATGRHSFKTFANRYGDDNLTASVMGHTSGDIGLFYDHGLDNDLRKMAEFLRMRLLLGEDGEGAKVTTGRPRARQRRR